MKRRVKANGGLYQYLLEIGVLENGTHEEIQAARKEYWREYKRKWRKERRRIKKEITISLNRQEWRRITREARRHNLSRTRFLRKACFAYINKSFVVPDEAGVRKIRQLLAMTYNSLQEMLEEDNVDFALVRKGLDIVQRLELDILPLLHHPKPLEEYLKDHVEKNPMNKDQLLKILNSL